MANPRKPKDHFAGGELEFEGKKYQIAFSRLVDDDSEGTNLVIKTKCDREIIFTNIWPWMVKLSELQRRTIAPKDTSSNFDNQTEDE